MQATTYQLELTFAELKDLKDAVHFLVESASKVQLQFLEAHDWPAAQATKRLQDRYRVLEQKIGDQEFEAWHDHLRNEHIRADVSEAERYADCEPESAE